MDARKMLWNEVMLNIGYWFNAVYSEIQEIYIKFACFSTMYAENQKVNLKRQWMEWL